MEARSTLRRIERAVDDADTADAAAAEQAWREAARLASRLERQARAVARDLIEAAAMSDRQYLMVPLRLGDHEALAERAAELGISIADLAARLLTRYLRPPGPARDAIDDHIGSTLPARAARHGRLPADASQRLREASEQQLRQQDGPAGDR